MKKEFYGILRNNRKGILKKQRRIVTRLYTITNGNITLDLANEDNIRVVSTVYEHKDLDKRTQSDPNEVQTNQRGHLITGKKNEQ